jgi:site-specific recombinase XerD
VVNYVADLRAFLRWSEKTNHTDSSPLNLGSQDIQRYCSFLHETKNHATATVNRRIQTLRKFYGYALTEGWIRSNPAEDVPLLAEDVSQRSRHLSTGDIERLLEVVRQGRPRWVARDWAIMQVLLGSGIKLTELTELKLTDVHLDHNPPSLNIASDNGSGRSVPLVAEVNQALEDYLSTRQASPGVEHLFINRDGRPLSTRSVQRLLRHYAKMAGLDSLTTQALRYVYARRVYEQYGDMQTVTELLGHRHAATTIRYLRPSAPQEEYGITDNPAEV